jgi:uncharacterized protein (DUF2461 family)
MEVLKELEDQGLRQLEEPAYKRMPRGYPSDHPRADLLRYGGLGAALEIPADTATSAELVETCIDFAVKARSLLYWLRDLND